MLQEVVAVFRTIDQAQAGRRPGENAWSLGEIADHLAITEREYLAVVARPAAQGTPHEFEYAKAVRRRPFRMETPGTSRSQQSCRRPRGCSRPTGSPWPN